MSYPNGNYGPHDGPDPRGGYGYGPGPQYPQQQQVALVGRPTSHAVVTALLFPISMVSSVGRAYISYWWSTANGKYAISAWVGSILLSLIAVGAQSPQLSTAGSLLGITATVALIYTAVSQGPVHGPRYVSPQQMGYGYGPQQGYGQGPDPRGGYGYGYGPRDDYRDYPREAPRDYRDAPRSEYSDDRSDAPRDPWSGV